MNKLDQKRIKVIAEMMPSIAYASAEYQEVTGEDLLLSGHKEVNGKPIEKEKSYQMRVPVYNEQNHYRRMKRAFLANGSEGLKRYLKPFVSDYEKTCQAIDIIFPKGEKKLFKALGLRVKS